MGIPIRGVWLMNSVCHLYHGVKMGLKLVVEKRESMGKKKKRRRRRRTKESGKGGKEKRNNLRNRKEGVEFKRNKE